MAHSTHALRRAVLLGLSLGLAAPACLEKDDDDDAGDSTPDTDSETDSETDSTTDVGTDSGTDTTSLDPVPEGSYPECEGSDTGLLVGPCCTDVYCIAAGSDGACRAADDVTAEEATGLGLGSGDCQCGPVEGPYAPRAGDPEACCYLVGVQGCTGRPVVVAGRLVRATPRRGRAWQAA